MTPPPLPEEALHLKSCTTDPVNNLPPSLSESDQCIWQIGARRNLQIWQEFKQEHVNIITIGWQRNGHGESNIWQKGSLRVHRGELDYL